MASNSRNALQRAKEAKDDEFYTLRADVERKVLEFADELRGAVVYCNCDAPGRSQVFEYLNDTFDLLELGGLIATYYSPEGFATVTERTPEGATVRMLEGDGGFASPECLDILSRADVVITNPPFSLFREFFATLLRWGGRYLVVSTLNAAKYEIVWPEIQAERLKLSGQLSAFDRPDGTRARLGNCVWFTNMRLHDRPAPLELGCSYDPDLYGSFDNYDAVHVPRTEFIPRDYFGALGVPISYLEKHNPAQFEILGVSRKFALRADLYTGDAAGTGNAFADGRALFDRVFIRLRAF